MPPKSFFFSALVLAKLVRRCCASDHLPSLTDVCFQNVHKDLCLQTLSSLQDRLPSFPTSIAMSVLEEELKRPVGDVFSELSP